MNPDVLDNVMGDPGLTLAAKGIFVLMVGEGGAITFPRLVELCQDHPREINHHLKRLIAKGAVVKHDATNYEIKGE